MSTAQRASNGVALRFNLSFQPANRVFSPVIRYRSRPPTHFVSMTSIAIARSKGGGEGSARGPRATPGRQVNSARGYSCTEPQAASRRESEQTRQSGLVTGRPENRRVSLPNRETSRQTFPRSVGRSTGRLPLHPLDFFAWVSFLAICDWSGADRSVRTLLTQDPCDGSSSRWIARSSVAEYHSFSLTMDNSFD